MPEPPWFLTRCTVQGRRDTLHSSRPILSSPFSPVLDLPGEPTQDHNNAIVSSSFSLSIAGLFTISGTVREVSYVNPQDQLLLNTRTMKHKTCPASLVSAAGAAGSTYGPAGTLTSPSLLAALVLAPSWLLREKFCDPRGQGGARRQSTIHVSLDLTRYSLWGPLPIPMISKPAT